MDQVNRVVFRKDVLHVLAFGKTEEKIVCPVCGKPKATDKLICQECYTNNSKLVKAVKRAIENIVAGKQRERKPQLSRGIKVDMVTYSIELLVKGAEGGIIPLAMAKDDEFSRVPEADRQKAVVDAQAAITFAPEIERYASENDLSFDDVNQLVDRFISEKANGRLTSFVAKAAIYCVIIPKMERDQSYEAKVAEAMSELDGMTIGDVLKTKPEDLRDSLIEAYIGDNENKKVGDGFRRFCYACAAEAIKRFKEIHKEQIDAEVQKTIDLGRSRTVNRFRGKGWNAKVANG